MAEEYPYQRILEEALKDELRLVNAHLPCEQKSLAELLSEEYPRASCSDGSTHLFKKKELDYLASLIPEEKRDSLLLPIIIEVNPGQGDMVVICQGGGEIEVITEVLNMPVSSEKNRIKIYGPQLSRIRKVLKTTTQYMFTPKILQ